MIDEFVSRKEIFTSLKKINSFLEDISKKDYSMHINNVDSEEIKDSIKKGYWQSIYGMYKTKKHSSEVIFSEIIKYSMYIKTIDKKYIKEIFESCDKKFFIEKAKKIEKNEISIFNENIKQIIEDIYITYK